jgi:hypothetical protein
MKADYGIDAPKVIRNLLIAGSLALAVAVAAIVGVIPRDVALHPSADTVIRLSPIASTLPAAVGLLGAACWMYLGSRFGKLKERERLLARIPWRGNERVLDVGCGRGLILVGSAHRLTTGSAVGVDIWQAEDLSGNRAEVPLRNAELEAFATASWCRPRTCDAFHFPTARSMSSRRGQRFTTCMRQPTVTRRFARSRGC